MALEQKISGGKLKEKVSDAVDFLAKQNIFTFEDKLGRVHSLENYANMAIKTIQSAAVAALARSGGLWRQFLRHFCRQRVF